MLLDTTETHLCFLCFGYKVKWNQFVGTIEYFSMLVIIANAHDIPFPPPWYGNEWDAPAEP